MNENFLNNRKINFRVSKHLNTELDKELMAAEQFLNKSNFDFMNKSSKNEIKNPENALSNDQIDEKNLISDLDNKLYFDPIISKYKKQLKSFGFPEIGNFYLNQNNISENEKIFKFFDYVIMKKTQETDDKMQYKRQIDMLNSNINFQNNQIIKYEKEINFIQDELKKFTKEKKENEIKIIKFKDGYEKQIVELKAVNSNILNKNNILNVEKKSYEEKFNKISEQYQKLINKCNGTSKPSNHFEILENLKKNDILKMLSKVTGAEKLIETFKNGFNESLREMLFEISALKNFIYEVNKDLITCIKNTDKNTAHTKQIIDIEYNLLNMPFLDTVNKIKYIFRNNFTILHKRLNTFTTTPFEGNNLSLENLKEYEMTFDKLDNSVFAQNHSNNNNNLIKNDDSFFSPSETYDDFTLTPKTNQTIIQESINNEKQLLDDENYSNELEFLKNKWVKTLMNIKSNNNEN